MTLNKRRVSHFKAQQRQDMKCSDFCFGNTVVWRESHCGFSKECVRSEATGGRRRNVSVCLFASSPRSTVCYHSNCRWVLQRSAACFCSRCHPWQRPIRSWYLSVQP